MYKILIIINDDETVARSNCNNITIEIIIPKLQELEIFYNLISKKNKMKKKYAELLIFIL